MIKRLSTFIPATIALVICFFAIQTNAATFEEARIYFEYNSTDNDLGVHIFLDGEDWKSLEIINPVGNTVFQVEGKGPYAQLGLTELFFEGAEPTLDEFPLEELLKLVPPGDYTLIGTTTDDEPIEGTALLTHAVPAGPEVSVETGINGVTIMWEAVSEIAPGFPDEPIAIIGYEIILVKIRPKPGLVFDAHLPATATQITIPPELIESGGEYKFEVLVKEKSSNQTITENGFKVEK